MKHLRNYEISIAFCFGLLFLFLPFSTGQSIPAAGTAPVAENAAESEPGEPFKIILSVNEVRLDVVVLDKNGNPITDLTAADFEVFQDDRRQEIKSGVYIDSRPDEIAQSAAARKGVPNLSSSHAIDMKKEDVRRTILFVVDDYGMNYENGYYAKMALRNFVEKQMLPGDLVSILRTGYGNRTLNMFQSDKREVLARINAMPSIMTQSEFNDLGMQSRNESFDGQLAWAEMRAHRLETLHENMIATLSYSLRALSNMPGRKILFMVTPLAMQYHQIQYKVSDINRIYYTGDEYDDSYVRLADEALRAGVVVNLLDIDGLYNYKTNYADASVLTWTKLDNEMWRNRIRRDNPMELILKDLRDVQLEPISRPNPMPAQTGGITIKDGNFFLDGIGKEAESLMKGYYLISYTPPPDTFEKRDKKDVFHRLKVRVNRKDAVVHTRSGFFGRPESELSADTPKQHPLIEAVYSPYQSIDLTVNIAAGYVKDAEAGYLVRSWIHLDPKDVKITEAEDGGARIDIETLCVTSDITGNIQDSKRAEFTLNIRPENKSENLAWIQKHGIRFSMLLPVKNPGSYYVRISVQDRETGNVGSAYQFLEIPDIGKKGLALSNIFMITSADDLNWMRSDVKKEMAGGVFLPVFQGDVRSPALRTYMPGDNLYAFGTLYNVDAKAIARSEIEMQSVLYRDGGEFRRDEPVPVTMNSANEPNGISILQRMTIASNMPPGDYVLQLLVTDKKNSKKNGGGAFQNLSFTVVENPDYGNSD